MHRWKPDNPQRPQNPNDPVEAFRGTQVSINTHTPRPPRSAPLCCVCGGLGVSRECLVPTWRVLLMNVRPRHQRVVMCMFFLLVCTPPFCASFSVSCPFLATQLTKHQTLHYFIRQFRPPLDNGEGPCLSGAGLAFPPQGVTDHIPLHGVT